MKKGFKIAKWVLGGLLSIILIAVIAGFLAHEPVPPTTGTTAQADQLARAMEQAVNKAAWDSTRWVSWQFRTGTTYLWDKEREMVQVEWGDQKVLLHTPSRRGLAYTDGELVTDKVKKQKLIQRAWSQFANDSFWLCAPMKAFDPGTIRELVDLGNGQHGLLVSYNSGGVTPGDQYLWLLDENKRPRAWRMWVNIIPVGGLELSWQDWRVKDGQPLLAKDHQGAMFSVPILDLQLEDEIAAVQGGADPLAALAKDIQ